MATHNKEVKDWLAEVKARTLRATPGPWSSHNPSPAKSGTWITGNGWSIAVCDTRTNGQCERDAAFIAAAREDIPRLLAIVERLSEHVDWATQTIHNAHHESGTWHECPKATCSAARGIWEGKYGRAL